MELLKGGCMKQFLTFTVLMASLLAHTQTKDGALAGRIKGTVTDQNGSPVPAATVYAVPQFSTFESFASPTVKTDANGQFDFHKAFQSGTYKIYSRKDADAYPDRSSSFYANPKFEAPKVDLTEYDPSAAVEVKLGDKAGVLVGKVIDADTGAALSAKLAFIDEDGNGDSVLAGGKYRELLPSDKDLTLMVMVMSPGYRQYPITSLRLQPGQEMQMDNPISKE